LTKENVLKLFSAGLSDRNIIKRLLMTRCIKMPLSQAENILWDLATSDDINYTLNTSENWLKSELYCLRI
jgi:hypothetical protein